MTILPKKKPSSTGVTDHSDDPDRRGTADPHPHAHQHASRTGSRPRASPPPWPYQAAPHTSREDRRIEPSSRSQQASPQPVVPGSSAGPCESSSASAVTCVVGTRGELACGTAVSGCCSGPGLSKRRRQTACPSSLPGGGGGGPGTDPEEGAGGNNSEDEYENAATQQSEDPATVEQVKRATRVVSH